MEQLLILVVVMVIWGISAWVKYSSAARQRQQRGGTGEPPPARQRSGLDEIRRFLKEISEPPRTDAPPPPAGRVQAPPRAPSAPGRAPGRPPTRRPAARPAAAAAPVGRPPRRPAPAGPTVARRPVAAPAPVRRTRVHRRPPTVSERLVQERMHVEDVPQEVESLARRARQVASIRPSKVSSLKVNIQAEAYEGVARTTRRGLSEVVQDLTSPLARAIILHEVIGPPLALRRPERTFADYG